MINYIIAAGLIVILVAIIAICQVIHDKRKNDIFDITEEELVNHWQSEKVKELTKAGYLAVGFESMPNSVCVAVPFCGKRSDCYVNDDNICKTCPHLKYCIQYIDKGEGE